MDTVNLHEMYQADATSRTASLVQHHTQFLAFLERRLGSRVEAEDVIQTAYMKALTAVESVRDDEKVIAWFYRLLRNILADRQRHQAATARFNVQFRRENPVSTEADEALYRTVCQCVLDLTALLKAEYREMLQRVELDELSLSQVAQDLVITPNNAAVRLHRARQAMRTALMQMCGTCAEHGCLECACQRPVVPQVHDTDTSDKNSA